ncbi:hypothetical protein TMCBR3_gp051 [Caulobacter phage TMCBR3]|nr:hypothetical protein TMCBR3_gp051 [Caulobacter phage TMCBR3]
MTKWPIHLIVFGETNSEPGPLQGHVRRSTACGVRVGNHTWRGWETRPGELAVAGYLVADDVDCARCMRTRAYKAAKP